MQSPCQKFSTESEAECVRMGQWYGTVTILQTQEATDE